MTEHRPGPIALALVSVAGLGAGVLFGLVAGEMLGDLNSDRMKQALDRLRKPDADTADDPRQLERDLAEAIGEHPELRELSIGVRALGNGLVELAGLVPDEAARRTATRVARRVPGAEVVVNRLLVEGIDTKDQPAATISSAP